MFMINLKRASKKMSSAGEKNFSKTGRRTNCVFIPKKTYIRKFTYMVTISVNVILMT